jgi:hypothetical protein
MKRIHSFSLFETAQELRPGAIALLNECVTGEWEYDVKTGLVMVDGNFMGEEKGLRGFNGIRFGSVTGDFICSNNQLTSLQGCPQIVDGNFLCDTNRLTSLEGAPEQVGRDFHCGNNSLTSLAGSPEQTGRDFLCGNNSLTSLVGGPSEVGGDFFCHNNKLTSLEGSPRYVREDFLCTGNMLVSLEGLPLKIGGSFLASENPVDGKVLRMIMEEMMSNGSDFLAAVKFLWNDIPLEDKALMYRPDFSFVDPAEASELKAIKTFNRIKDVL